MHNKQDNKQGMAPSTWRRLIVVILTIGTIMGSILITPTSMAVPSDGVLQSAQAEEIIQKGTVDTVNETAQGKAIEAPKSPDVTIKDELTEDEASVTDIKVNQIVDGTAPFDNDDNRGDDSSDGNLRVRSFDRITYLIETTVSPDNPMTYYKNARIGYKITLPVDKDQAVFNYEAMGWVDRSKDYSPKLTENPDGSQTLVVFKPLNSTDEAPTVIPGTYEVPIIIDVKAMHEGEILRPKVEAWTYPNGRTHRTMEITPDPITVTSIPKYDIDIRGEYQTSGVPSVWDFGKTDPKDKPITSSDGMNRELGKQKGVLSYIRFGINMRWKDTSKHLRGLEIPRPGEPMKISLDVSNTVTKDGESDPMESDARLQPYFWAANSHYGYMQGMKSRETSPTWRANEWSSHYPYFYNEGGPARVYNGGDLTIDQIRSKDKTRLDITIKNWEIDPNKFPRGPGNYGQCNTMYSTSDCTIRVAQFSQGAIYMFSPTQIDGRDLPNHYASNVTLKQRVETSGIDILSDTGDRVTVQEDPTDSKGNPTNNTINKGLQLTPSGGKFSMKTWYACSKDHANYTSYGTECSGWAGATFNGTDKAPVGSMVRLHMQNNYSTSNSWELAGVFSINLAKIDDKLLEVPKDLKLSDAKYSTDWQDSTSGGWWSGNNGGRGFIRPIIRYATKPDGTGWKDDTEQSNTMIDDLRYWDDYNEAKAHGVIVGFIIASKEAGGNNSESFFPLRAMVHVKNDPANIGKTAQFTQVAESWTRQDLMKAGVVPSDIKIDDLKPVWDKWTKTVDPMELRKKVKPTYHMDSKGHYRKSTYDSAGTYHPGTEGMIYGDTLLVSGEASKIGLSTEQQKPDGDGIGKTIYDLDNGQRYIDWIMTPSSEAPGGRIKTDHKITVTIPKGLSYVPNSSHLNGDYKEQTPNQGENTGTVIEPIVTSNKNGTTTLTYDVPEVQSDGKSYSIRFSTYIGDPTDPDNDAQNGQQYVMNAKIQSSYDIVPSTTYNKKEAIFTVQVSRTRANQLATRSMTLINDTNQPLTFKSMIANSSSTDKTDVWAVDLLPWNEIGGSNYHGDHTLTSIALKGIGLPVEGNVTVYVTTDPRYRTITDPSGKTDPNVKITGSEISSQWTRVPVGKDGTVDLSSIKGKATGFAVHLNNLNPKARLEVVWSITPNGNSGADVYGNRWSDLSNTVTSLTSIADREVNGVVWWDANEDGARQSDEKRIPNVKVEVVDSNGHVITKTDGSEAVTYTNKDGRWSVSKIPAGVGHKVRLTPKASDGWIMNTTTLKRSGDVPMDKNSDADPLLVLNRMKAAEISLDPFPTVDEMTSSRYVDSYEDAGLKYANFVQRATPNTGGRDLMILVSLVIVMIALVTTGVMLGRQGEHEDFRK